MPFHKPFDLVPNGTHGCFQQALIGPLVEFNHECSFSVLGKTAIIAASLGGSRHIVYNLRDGIAQSGEEGSQNR
jgi:hypothetical protein